MVNHFLGIFCEKGFVKRPWCFLVDEVLENGVCLEDDERAPVSNAEPLGGSQPSAVDARMDRFRLSITEKNTQSSRGYWLR